MHEYGWSPDDWTVLRAVPRSATCWNVPGNSAEGISPTRAARTSPAWRRSASRSPTWTADGHATLGKVDGTGGRITVATATEQLLYEVTDPHGYLTPDVTADFSGVTLEETARDRVAVRGARGRARPDQLKVSVGYLAGYVGEGEIGYAGANAVARAELAAQILRERLRERFNELRIDLIGSSSLHGRAFDRSAQPYEVRLRVAARGATHDEATIVGDEVEALYTNGPAGGGGTRKAVTEQIGIVSTLIDRARVTSQVTLHKGGALAEAG